MSLPRTGHAPERVREQFQDLAEGGGIHNPVSKVALVRLTGQLWSATDVVPAWACKEIDVPQGSAYAQAARSLRPWLAHRIP